MRGGSGRWTRDGTSSWSEEEKRNVVCVVSVLVHQIQDMLLELDRYQPEIR